MKKPLIILLFLNSIAYGSENANIAVVNIEKVISEAKVTKNVIQQIGQKREAFQEEIDRQESELKDMESELEEKRKTLSAEAFERKAKTFHTRVAEVQRGIQMKRVAIEEDYNDAIGRIKEIVADIIRDYAKENHLSLVISTEQVLYNTSQIDISPIIARKLDQKVQTLSIKRGVGG